MVFGQAADFWGLISNKNALNRRACSRDAFIQIIQPLVDADPALAIKRCDFAAVEF